MGTVGNMPFRRICVEFGAQITCSEMAMSTNLLKGMRGEWALCRRHESEKQFGIQIAAGFVDSACKTMEYLHHCTDLQYDFIDLNVGCPLDELCNRRCGAALMRVPYHLRTLLRGMHGVINCQSENGKAPCALTCKMRKGFFHSEPNGKELIDILCGDGSVSAIGIHGRSRQQRYRRPADWRYIRECVAVSRGRVPIIGNGDIYEWNEAHNAMSAANGCAT